MSFKSIMDRLVLLMYAKGVELNDDKSIAHALGMSYNAFYSAQKRDSLPYERICSFCARNRININMLFYSQPTDTLRFGRVSRLK